MKKVDFFVVLSVVLLLSAAVCMVWLIRGMVIGWVEWWSPVLVAVAFAHLYFHLHGYLKSLKTEEPKTAEEKIEE